MRKLVLVVIVLLALFALFRAYSQGAGPGQPVAGIRLQPGLVEIDDGAASLGLSFGVMEKSGGRLVSILPLRVVFRNGDRSVSLGLNGLAFLLSGATSVGAPLVISTLHAGDVISVGGPVTVDARVQGSVWTLGADVTLSPRAAVTGDVVAIGGRVNASPRAVVGGAVSQLPQLRIPFLGVLGAQFSVTALSLSAVALGYVLFGFALFLSSYYLGAHARDMQEAMPSLGRPALFTTLVSLAAIPAVTALLVASVVGVLLLPLLALALFLLALDGFLCLSVRVGVWMRSASGPGSEGSLYLFTSGLLALFLVNVPALVGILLGAFRSPLASRIGTLLQALSLALVMAGLLYGLGVSLAYARSRVSRRG